MKKIRIQFAVSGATRAELEEKACEEMAGLLGADAVPDDITLDVRPLVQDGTGAVRAWEAEVEAVV